MRLGGVYTPSLIVVFLQFYTQVMYILYAFLPITTKLFEKNTKKSLCMQKRLFQEPLIYYNFCDNSNKDKK